MRPHEAVAPPSRKGETGLRNEAPVAFIPGPGGEGKGYLSANREEEMALRERFNLEPEKWEGVVRSVQAIHPEATEDDIRTILLDESAQDDYQDWLDDAPEEEITDRVRQYLENTTA
ncbi:MAG: hypothetical protein KY468_20240 [Armatimonadetes bacterium]|nr:hypothetical protein [Armatimonadota bacterium]